MVFVKTDCRFKYLMLHGNRKSMGDLPVDFFGTTVDQSPMMCVGFKVHLAWNKNISDYSILQLSRQIKKAKSCRLLICWWSIYQGKLRMVLFSREPIFGGPGQSQSGLFD